MKMKKRLPLCARVLATTLFSGCASGSQKISFNNYWNENALVFERIHETLVYDVTFEKATTYGYELAYENGSYKTELISQTDENGRNVYLYKTELSIDVTYTFQGESKTLTDNVKTEVQFLTADNGLTPLRSQKTIVSSSPVGSAPTSLEGCYHVFSYQVDTVYTDNAGTATVKTGEESSTQSFTIEQNKYSYLDNEQLWIGLRAMRSSASSARVFTYSPFTNSVQTIAIAFSSAESKDFSFYKNGSTEKMQENISYRPARIQLDEWNSGAAQTAWIATTTDTASNKYRNIILQLQTPLAYGLGTLVYNLTSISYQ